MLSTIIEYNTALTIYFFIRNTTSYQQGMAGLVSGGYLSCRISQDGGTLATTTNAPAEVDATYLPGVYSVLLTAGETAYGTIMVGTYYSAYPSYYQSEPVMLFTDANPRQVNVGEIEGDGSAPANLANAYNGTGYAGGSTLQNVNVGAVSGDTTAADNLELFMDGTGYAGGTTPLNVNVSKISGDSTSADNAELFFDGTGYGIQGSGGATGVTIQDGAITDAKIPATVGANLKQVNGSTTGVSGFGTAITTVVPAVVNASGSTSSSIVSDTSSLSAADDAYNSRTLIFTSGSLQNEARVINDYVGFGSGTATLSVSTAFTGTPADDDEFIIN